MDYTACDGALRFRNKPGAELVNRFKLLCLMRAKLFFFFSFEKVWSWTGHLGTII